MLISILESFVWLVFSSWTALFCFVAVLVGLFSIAFLFSLEKEN